MKIDGVKGTKFTVFTPIVGEQGWEIVVMQLMLLVILRYSDIVQNQ